ncbi:hypothetical protein D3C86_2070990 [compost metagenome]
MVSGQPFRIGRLHHRRRFATEGRSQFLHADFAIGRHDAADRLAVDLGHQRLQHPARILAERLGRLQADALRIGIIVIGMHAEGDAGL